MSLLYLQERVGYSSNKSWRSGGLVCALKDALEVSEIGDALLSEQTSTRMETQERNIIVAEAFIDWISDLRQSLRDEENSKNQPP